MSSSIPIQLFQEIIASRIYLQEALDRYKERIDQLNHEDTLELVNQIVENGKIFHYLEIVGYSLRKIASPENNFFNILITVIKKIGGDMAGYLLLNQLVEVGVDNPELGLQIYKKAKELKNPKLLLACRWIFAGVGKKNFALACDIVSEDIEASEPELRICSLSAIRIAFANGLASDWMEAVFSLLESKKDDPDQGVKKELLNTYITFYSYAKEPCLSSILYLCKKDDQLNIDASNLLMHKELATAHYLKMIEFLSSSQDKFVIEMVLLSFYSWAKKEIIEPELQIIYELLKRFSYFDIRQIEEALKELGKVDQETCLKHLYCWQEKANPKLKFQLPKIAVAFARSDFNKLVDTFTQILFDEKKEWFIFETSRYLLQEIFERSSEGKNPSPSDERTISNLLEKLKDLARTKGLNAEAIANREHLSIYKCLILIEVMNSVVLNIDFTVIGHNLDFYPNIRDFLGEKWLRKMQREQNKTHPLLVYLADSMMDPAILEHKTQEVMALEGTARKIEAYRLADSMRNRSLLIHLESEICLIKGNSFLRSIKAGLREEQQFWKVFSEIDVLSRLSQTFSLQIGPPLEIQENYKTRIKHPDFGLTFDGKDTYIEVISPEMFPPLRYFHNAGIPNRVRGKITDEIKHHFKGMKTPKDVLIIVDLASSELRYDSIQDYVQGELQFVFKMNVATHDAEGVFTQRGEPMTIKDEHTKIIIGIIGYSRVVGTDDKIHLKGRQFLNPQSENKSEVLERVTKALLG